MVHNTLISPAVVFAWTELALWQIIYNCMFVSVRECAEISAFHLIISPDSSCVWIEVQLISNASSALQPEWCACVCMQSSVDVGVRSY